MKDELPRSDSGNFHPGSTVIQRDLVKNPVPHVGPDFVYSRHSKPDADSLALSRQLIGEIMASDVLLIEAPMYNFNISVAPISRVTELRRSLLDET